MPKNKSHSYQPLGMELYLAVPVGNGINHVNPDKLPRLF
jgi:hypothetical protein